MNFRKFLLVLSFALFSSFIANAEDSNSNSEQTVGLISSGQVKDVYDPLEPLNRRVYKFNYYFDRYVLFPVAKTYLVITPKPVQKGIGNFLGNLGEIPTFVNSVLQLKPKSSGVTLSRFVINSTIGIFGIFDVADKFGLKKRKEDFGQTLAYYGVGAGPYLIVPFLGPSNARDLTGLAADTYTFEKIDPLNFDAGEEREYFYFALEAVDTRVKVPIAYYESGSPFEYELLRRYYTDSRKIKAGSFISRFKHGEPDSIEEMVENDQ